MAGAGLSLVPFRGVADEIATGRLRVVPTADPMPSNPFVIAYPDPNVDIATRAIVEIAKDVAQMHAVTPDIKVRRSRAASVKPRARPTAPSNTLRQINRTASTRSTSRQLS